MVSLRQAGLVSVGGFSAGDDERRDMCGVEEAGNVIGVAGGDAVSKFAQEGHGGVAGASGSQERPAARPACGSTVRTSTLRSARVRTVWRPVPVLHTCHGPRVTRTRAAYRGSAPRQIRAAQRRPQIACGWIAGARESHGTGRRLRHAPGRAFRRASRLTLLRLTRPQARPLRSSRRHGHEIGHLSHGFSPRSRAFAFCLLHLTSLACRGAVR